jgi:UDP-N-acetylglucosamine acyltransferase
MTGNDPIIHPSAKIGEKVKIGPWSYIGPDVVIGDNCEIKSHVVIKGPTFIGDNNTIFQFASIGEDPSDLKFKGEYSVLEIGSNNTIREGATIHRGTGAGGGKTIIGSHNLFMPYTHVAHDCIIGDHVIFSNNAAVSGHVIVEDWVILAGFAGVYQFIRVGAHSFVGGLTHVNMDVPAYVMVNGSPPEPKGINITGLERRGFSKKSIQGLRKAYKILYRQGLSLEQAISALEQLQHTVPEVDLLVNSVRLSRKGIMR